MKKKIITNFKYILLFSSAILLIGAILTLGLINHFDFDRSVINAELRELLIIAKSASHDIENKILGVKQEPQYIDKLIQHINDEEKFATFVMDNKHIIISDPVKRNLGKDIFEVGEEVLNSRELSELNAFVEKLDSSSSGTAILRFPTKDEKPNKETKLFAFAHFQGQNGINSVVITERLSALTGPIHRNLRDSLMFVGLFLIVLIVFIYVFYRIQEKRIKAETSAKALEIINKQLHCDISDYKCIEEKLKKGRR